MEFLPVVCLCLLSCSGTTSAAGKEPKKTMVDEDGEAILSCSFIDKRNLENAVFEWKKDGQKGVFKYDAGRTYNDGLSGQDEQFKGRVSYFEDELKNGDGSIIIQNTSRADNGVYTCDFPHMQPRVTFSYRLIVAPKPSAKILNQTKDQAVLQCEVVGAFLKPEIVWRDRSGNNITSEAPQVKQSGDSYDVVLTTTVTKTGRYRCVVIQHWIISDTYVYFEGSSAGRIVGFSFVNFLLISGVVLGVM